MNKKQIARKLLKIASEIVGAKDDKCGEKGCVRKRTVERKDDKTGKMTKQERWGIMSGKTGKWWNQTFDTKEKAEKVLQKYHAGF